jgi:hypothetical protein
MGLHAGEAGRRGYGKIKDGYLDHHLTFLRGCERDYLKGAASSKEPPPSKP